MLSARFTKLISLILIFSLTAGYLLAQYEAISEMPAQPEPTAVPLQNTQTESSISHAIQQGQLDAKGSLIYGCGGFACGVFGILAAVISDPQPDAVQMMQLSQTKGADYAMAYKTAYSKKAKNKNLLYAGLGWGVGLVASTAYYVLLLQQMAEDNDDYKN